MTSKAKMLRAGLAGVGAAALLLAMSPVVTNAVGPTATTATARPGSAGSPQPGQVIYSEDFGDGTSTSSTTPIGVTEYNTNYTADAPWMTLSGNCNGWIVNWNTPIPTVAGTDPSGASVAQDGCKLAGGKDAEGIGNNGWWYLQQMANALGQAQGMSPAAANANNAVSAETNGGVFMTDNGNDVTAATKPGTALPVQFQVNNAAPVIPNHYYQMSIWVAAAHCSGWAGDPGGANGWASPQETLKWVVNGSAVETDSVPGDPCGLAATDPTKIITVDGKNAVPAPTLNNGKADAPVVAMQMVSGVFQAPANASTLGLQLSNSVLGHVGNDVAYDTPVIVDVTPQIDKAITGSPIDPGDKATLTFTVTNTDDYLAKPGWSFTDNLPDGMTIADSNATNTCGDVPTVKAGDTSVTATGDLLAGEANAVCTITVDVTSDTPNAKYVNGPGADSTPGTTGGSNFGSATTETDANGQPIKDADGNPVTYYSGLSGLWAPADAPLDVNGPILTIKKTPSPLVVTSVGEAVDYSFLVTNTGTAPAYNVSVTDEFTTGGGTMTKDIDCGDGTATIGTLQPGDDQAVTCTATYTSVDADVTAGTIDNTATVTGTSTADGDTSNPDLTATDDATVPVAALELTKSASPAVISAAGDVTYTFTVTNTGSVPIDNVTVTDPGPAGGTGTMQTPITCTPTTLAPTEQATCTATYKATADDIAANKELVNTATAAGTTPSDPTDPNSTPVPVTSNEAHATVSPASLLLVKKADPAVISAPGDVTYTFSVTNTGSVPIDNVTVTDPGPAGGTGTMQTPTTCTPTTLAPTEQATCTAIYKATADDIAANKELVNTATAAGTATDPSDPSKTVDVTSNEATATVDIASLTLLKDPAAQTVSTTGPVTWTLTATNTGTAPLTDVMITDDTMSNGGAVTVGPCAVNDIPVDDPTAGINMAAGDVVTCTATYTVTPDDIANPTQLTNTATAAGTAVDPNDPSKTIDVAAPDATATVDIAQITVQKSADVASVANPDDPVNYSFLVTNTGTVELNPVSVSDDMLTAAGITISCPSTDLAAGANMTCTASGPYSTTQADIDALGINNTATATGTPPATTDDPNPKAVTATDTLNIPVAKIQIVKSADVTSVVKANDPVNYSFVVTNIGSVTLTDVNVTDPMLAGINITCPLTTLEPQGDPGAPAANSSTTCTADDPYLATQADIDALGISNTATATGTPPANPDTTIPATPVTADSKATVGVSPTPALVLTKDADTNALPHVGGTINYTFTVTNVGDGTAYNVAIDDPMFTNVKCDSTTLVPQGDPANPATGSSTTCTATYTVQQSDLNRGWVNNQATATGWNDPTCTVATDPFCFQAISEPKTAYVPGTPALSLVKSVDKTTLVAGETATFSYAVTNTGTAPAYNLTIQEDSFTGSGQPSAISCPVTTLLPGQTTTCTNTYVMTAADVQAGVPVTNTATALGATAQGSRTFVPSNDSSAQIAPPPPPGVPANTGASVISPMVLWPMLALMIVGMGVWMINWRRKLAA